MTIHSAIRFDDTAEAAFDAATVLPPYSADPDAAIRFARAFGRDLARTATAGNGPAPCRRPRSRS